jgi:hypothetical protein
MLIFLLNFSTVARLPNTQRNADREVYILGRPCHLFVRWQQEFISQEEYVLEEYKRANNHHNFHPKKNRHHHPTTK